MYPYFTNTTQGRDAKKSSFMSETQVERIISKSKSLFALLLVEQNTSEEVTLFHPLIQSPLNAFYDPITLRK